MTELTLPVLGPVVSARQYPFRSLRRHGATLVMGSDWSVSTPDPFLQMEVAVNRVSDDSRAARRSRSSPAERLELVDILAAATAGSAYAQHLDEAGVLAVGRLADLAILDRDLFDRGPGADRRDPRRSRPSSRASRSTRRPPSTADVGGMDG